MEKEISKNFKSVSFQSIDLFKKYLNGRAGRNALGDATAQQILETLKDEDIYNDNFRDRDDFNCIDKLRGYAIYGVTLKVNEEGWKYYVRFTNSVGGNMVLKVYQKSFMYGWERKWEEGTIKLETETVQEMYDFVYKTSNSFFNSFDSEPDELFKMIQRVLSQDTSKVKLEIDVESAYWTLTLEYKDREPIAFER